MWKGLNASGTAKILPEGNQCRTWLTWSSSCRRKGNLVRFRAQKWAELLHQDPVEESLCNAFAAELLMPTYHVDKRLSGSKLGPRTIFDIADVFCVSMQASAKRVVRLLGTNRSGCSLWKVTKDGWSLPVWWTGLQAEGRDLKRMTDVVSAAAENRVELAQVWPWTRKKRGRKAPKDRQVIVQVAPTLKAQHFLAFVAFRSCIDNQSRPLNPIQTIQPQREQAVASGQTQLTLPFV